MQVQKTNVQDCVLINGCRYYDSRGFYQVLYSETESPKEILRQWKQVNHSFSEEGVLRGIHQAPFCKLFSCLQGSVLDVVVDLRPESPTYLNYACFSLKGSSADHVFIPAGCGHGFYAYSESLVLYLQDDVYGPNKENTWHWQSLGINWPKAKQEYILSEKDKNAPPYPKNYILPS